VRYQSLEQQRLANMHLIPSTTSGTAGVAISYALSPRTQFGFKATTTRMVSELYDGYNTTSTASIGRTFAAHWVLQAYGGVGVPTVLRRTTGAAATGPHPVEGGSFGYRAYAHTFLGSYDRSVSDSYGAGARTSSNASFSWHWERPGSGWMLNANLTWQQLEYTGLRTASGWRTNFGWGRALGRSLWMIAEYTYLDYSGQVRGDLYTNSQSALRCSLVWRPPSVFGR
jgi:hypothetical protein